MIKMSINEVKNLLKDMEENNINAVEFDFHSYEPIEAVDFDMWKDGKFIKTLLSIEINA